MLWLSFWLGVAGGVWSIFQTSGFNWQSQLLIATVAALLLTGGLEAIGAIGALAHNPIRPEIVTVVRVIVAGFGLKFFFTSHGKDWFARQEPENAA